MAWQKGRPRDAETVAKIRATSQAKWLAPEFRAQHLARSLAQLAAARAVRARKGIVRPPKGTAERKVFDKLARIMGPDATRAALGLGP